MSRSTEMLFTLQCNISHKPQMALSHNWVHIITIAPVTYHIISITRDHVIFGMTLQKKGDELCCNVILCLAKNCIHKNRILKSSRKMIVFLNEFQWYQKSLKIQKGSKAQCLFNILKEFPTDPNRTHLLVLYFCLVCCCIFPFFTPFMKITLSTLNSFIDDVNVVSPNNLFALIECMKRA